MAELVSKVYAEALFEVALEINQLDEVNNDMQAVCEIFNENPEFLQLYKTPNISLDERKALLDHTFSGHIMPEVLNFLKLLIDKNRGFYVIEICSEFEHMVEERKGILKGIVHVTCSLSDDQIKKLEDKLSTSTGKQVVLSQKINPSIIGGMIVNLGDKVIDSSLKKKLDDMKDELFQLIV